MRSVAENAPILSPIVILLGLVFQTPPVRSQALALPPQHRHRLQNALIPEMGCGGQPGLLVSIVAGW